MKIMMFTNTFTPHVGGVARSVERFSEEFRELGHSVVVVAPEFEDQPELDRNVIRVPAIQKFHGGDFSVSLPLVTLEKLLQHTRRPDIIHSHHPYLLGDTALRLSAKIGVPVVFTHHTMYEQYTHYVPGDSPAMKRFVVELATRYANMCSRVIAPSESVRTVLRGRGVDAPIAIIPTGVDVDRFAAGDGERVRLRYGIPRGAFVVGYLGRLAPEKNLDFLARAVAHFLRLRADARFLVGGYGPSSKHIQTACAKEGVLHRVHFAGRLKGGDVVDAYHAMDVFAFASKTETQGMVLAEAMAAGIPVVALDAPGVREVVQSGRTGVLLRSEGLKEFRDALGWVEECLARNPKAFKKACVDTARSFSMRNCALAAIALYHEAISRGAAERPFDMSRWESLLRSLRREWELWNSRLLSLADALLSDEARLGEDEEQREDDS